MGNLKDCVLYIWQILSKLDFCSNHFDTDTFTNLIELIFVRIRIHLKEDMVYVKMESCRMILKLLETFLALFSYCKAAMRLFNMSKDYTSFLEGEQYCTSCVSCYG